MKCRLLNPFASSRFGISLIALILCATPVKNSLAQQPTQIEAVALGLGGNVILGYWTPFRARLSGDLAGASSIEIETMDGDAVPVNFRWTIDQAALKDQSQIEGLVRIGRVGKLTVRIFDKDDALIVEKDFSRGDLSEQHRFHPSTTDLKVVVGWDEEVTEEDLNRLFGSDAAAIVSDPMDLPANHLGLESATTLVIAANEGIDWAAISPTRMTSIHNWIRSGGHLLISGGRLAERLVGSGQPFESLPNLSFVETRQTRDSGSIELLVGSTDPLVSPASEALHYSIFEAPPQFVHAELEGGAIMIHLPHGMGQVSVLGLDLNEEPIRSWKDSGTLISRALMNQRSNRSGSGTPSTGQVSHNGYDDISGQLRVSLDEFSNVSFVTFTTVAILIALFILAIGAGDYFFLRKFVGRMEWTWLTFLLIAVIFCGVIIWLSSATKSSSIELNQVEVIDLDTQSGDVWGSVVTHFYSPGTASYDVALPTENSIVGSVDQSWITWHGLPGTGMGGMQSRNDVGLYRRSYEIEIDSDDRNAGHATSAINGMPMQTASTKALAAQWSGHMSNLPLSNLKQNDNTDAINGTFTNPFPVRLDNVVLFYDDWAYVLSGSLDEGETIDVESEMREKTINGYFTRRKQEGKTDITTPWSTTDTSLTRIVDVIMFFEAAGGEVYTTLTNDYMSRLDASDQLRLGRAVLVGQVRKATTPLNIDGEASGEHYDKQITFVRAVLPVEPRKSHRKNR